MSKEIKETDLPEEKKQAIRPEELRLNNLVTIDNPRSWPDLKGKPNFLHYLAEIDGRGEGLYCLLHDEIELEAMPQKPPN